MPIRTTVMCAFEEYFFRLRRNSQEAISAWALREENVYLRITRALARFENADDSHEPDRKSCIPSRTAGPAGDGRLSARGAGARNADRS